MEVTSFSFLRQGILVLAFPISNAAEEVASMTSLVDMVGPFSSIAVIGARASSPNV